MNYTLEDRINAAREDGWDWEQFEDADGNTVLQVWPKTSMVMYEYIFTADGQPLEGYVHYVCRECVEVEKMY